jgi:hypothetical protein
MSSDDIRNSLPAIKLLHGRAFLEISLQYRNFYLSHTASVRIFTYFLNSDFVRGITDGGLFLAENLLLFKEHLSGCPFYFFGETISVQYCIKP